MEEVEIQTSQPGSTIVLQGRHDAFAEVRGRDKGDRVRCLGSETLNLRQQLEDTLAELQAATQRIAELEALLVAHDEPGTSNTAYQAALDRIAELEALLRTDAEIRNSP
ncbi:hypothetical protein C5167_043973 [Papaver somniferum]|uniref:Uncharacterized protein n=1 Tax=Papaver somniferum TaxID=3469 RepID=A0A4Y7LA60_PAPSO|nr:hypothetical protein C5167_043973 [Papaver somniferum]